MRAARSVFGVPSPAVLLLLICVSAVGDTRAFVTAPFAPAKPAAHAEPAISPTSSPDDPLKGAVMQRVIQFPFEVVLDAWTQGPTDTNFLKEEYLENTVTNGEAVLKKLLYTKNPLPFLLRQTMVPPQPRAGGFAAATRPRSATVQLVKRPLVADQSCLSIHPSIHPSIPLR
ncbi:hypothetical protein T484DRAFT_1886965 [Baffinella frigidus]|nr:hypothetical protein T484DRAFT_1886965 [Cryptophyta sp. CCMP2293]